MYTLRLACSHVSACEAYNVNDATALNWRHLAPPVHVLACEALWMRREFAEQLCRDACLHACVSVGMLAIAGSSKEHQRQVKDLAKLSPLCSVTLQLIAPFSFPLHFSGILLAL